MNKEDLEFIADILENSSWLFYGDFEEPLNNFLKKLFKHDFSEYGFEHIKMKDDFATAYWAIVSEMVRLDLLEYGTSPRGAWLTEKGERFKRIIIDNKNVIEKGSDYIYRKYNGN